VAAAVTTCCIVGGGPAGMMLGLLLARAGVDVVVLEKHADFLRDFRGDTIHPSTLEVMHELGLLERFLALPHQKVESLSGRFGDVAFGADFSHLPTRRKFMGHKTLSVTMRYVKLAPNNILGLVSVLEPRKVRPAKDEDERRAA